ncbi:hypothetical protein HMPREF0742_00423 [Rothia aeria F0184]|uniref:Uncharacterized protein n=1 Tax=Rothia aeria F0184 TaxID=888019 RepID=U7V9N4_9MICC|nr:hypothetical protein HMPREF0742_00423 [Rothia aeria F0184]
MFSYLLTLCASPPIHNPKAKLHSLRRESLSWMLKSSSDENPKFQAYISC